MKTIKSEDLTEDVQRAVRQALFNHRHALSKSLTVAREMVKEKESKGAQTKNTVMFIEVYKKALDRNEQALNLFSSDAWQ